MKWKDWVKEVERQIKDKGIEDNPEIFYIDTHMPYEDDMSVGFDKDSGLTIID